MRNRTLRAPALWAVSTLIGCGGGGAPTVVPQAEAPSAPTPAGQVARSVTAFPGSCGRNEAGTLYLNAEAEPHLAVNPARAANLIAAWQQDRWNNGAARGIGMAVSQDGGATWAQTALPFSICAGGTFERASDPWVTIGPTGIAYQMALAVTGSVFAPGSLSAMLVSRSTDNGVTWSQPLSLIQDTAPFFNDKNSITADPTDPRFVYAAWDRLRQNAGGPAYLARSEDSGLSYAPARLVFDPGPTAQTIGAEIVVAGDGTVLYFFTLIEALPNNRNGSSLNVLRSPDHGVTWSDPIRIADMLATGTRDPETGAAVRDGSLLAHAAAGSRTVVVTFQDGRFSGGARDGIAFVRSEDSGQTWSEPARINGDPSAAAFTAQPVVMADGSVSVAYFDLRSNTPDPASLPTNYWMTTTRDGTNWTEISISGPFNLQTAPNANGLFLGDYMGFAASQNAAHSLHVRTVSDANNPTDVFFTSPGRVASASVAGRSYRSEFAREGDITEELRDRVSEDIARRLGAKLTRRPLPVR